MVLCASLFSQLVAIFSRREFFHLVIRHRAERYSKGYGSWEHFVAMLFCQLAQAKSLREICGGLACTMGKLRQLGMRDAPNKSTLSYANTHRPWEMFHDLFYETVKVCKMAAPKNYKFRFRNKMLSLDATTIALCLALFPWAEFRRTKGPSNCICFWIMADTFPPTFPTVRNMKSPSLEKSLCPLVLSQPWIEVTGITSYTAPRRMSSFSLSLA